jgi:membrane-anchored mycosin MYCP
MRRAALAVAPAIAIVLAAGGPGALAATPTLTAGMPRGFAGCNGKPQPGSATPPSGVPWAQQALNFSSVWPITRGQGVTVAVVDSGVEYTSQLNGRVQYTDLTHTGGADCVGHGTGVAGIIAASQNKAIPFYGVAPAAHIVSIKVATQETNVSPALVVQGIRAAISFHAQVINLSIQQTGSTPALHQAIEDALSHNIVVVAAAGNDTQNNNGTVSRGPFYPAAYRGVLSVGAADSQQEVTSLTPTRTPISVIAPGDNVLSTYPGGFALDSGTSFATAFVSGEAALLRAAYPHWSATKVVARIIATADGHFGDRSGAGMINPVQAVTGLEPPPSTSASASPKAVSIPSVPHGNATTRIVAVSVTGGAIALAVLVVIVAMTVPHGRQRRWRPGRVDVQALGAKADETGSVWGDDLPATDHQIPARGPGTGPDAGPRSLTPN